MARLTNPAVVELDIEMLLALLIGPASEDAFTDDELEAAWRYHRDDLTGRAVYRLPGCRPWAWWEFEAGRPEHLEEYPLHFEGTVDANADAIDAYQIEPIVYLAANGHLRDDEVAAFHERATEAQIRIGTPTEHIGSGGVDRPDRRAVKLYEAVREAMPR